VRRVALAGTFDVGNYGDLLFPLIAARRLAPLGWEVVPVTPTGRASGFADALPPRTLDEVAGCDALLIGGGEIIHAWPARFVAEYADVAEGAYAALWDGATRDAVAAGSPVAWNAPGVLAPVPARVREEALGPALSAAAYVSVRDRASAAHLAWWGGAVAVVPDTAAEVGRLWSADVLDCALAGLAARHGFLPGEGLLAVQVRPGGGGRATAAELARLLEDFAAAQGLLPVLLSIGPSLGDGATLRALSAAMAGRHVLLDAPARLCDVAAVLARARGYVGNSLHGYITACAHGVPGAIVARPAFRKFEGFASEVGRGQDVVRDWDGGFARLGATLAAADRPVLGAEVFARLDAHWNRIAAVIGRA